MNKVILIGRLTRKPDFKSLSDGKEIVTFGVATNYRRGEYEEVFFGECVAFGSKAEIIAEMDKGSGIVLSGRLFTRQYKDENGYNKSTTRIMVESFKIVEFPKHNVESNNAPDNTNNTSKDDEDVIIDEEIESLLNEI